MRVESAAVERSKCSEVSETRARARRGRSRDDSRDEGAALGAEQVLYADFGVEGEAMGEQSDCCEALSDCSCCWSSTSASHSRDVSSRSGRRGLGGLDGASLPRSLPPRCVAASCWSCAAYLRKESEGMGRDEKRNQREESERIGRESEGHPDESEGIRSHLHAVRRNQKPHPAGAAPCTRVKVAPLKESEGHQKESEAAYTPASKSLRYASSKHESRMSARSEPITPRMRQHHSLASMRSRVLHRSPARST